MKRTKRIRSNLYNNYKSNKDDVKWTRRFTLPCSVGDLCYDRKHDFFMFIINIGDVDRETLYQDENGILRDDECIDYDHIYVPTYRETMKFYKRLEQNGLTIFRGRIVKKDKPKQKPQHTQRVPHFVGKIRY